MKLDQLTFTRYLAALTVVFFHFGQTAFPASHPLWNPVVAAGPIAVSYFFVLSGFIMAVAYYAPDRPLAKGKYWLARFARIYPVYLLALLLMIAANLKTDGSSLLTVTLSLSMLQAWLPGYAMTLNSPGWSLSVEAFFYLCFPLLLLAVRKYSPRKLLLITLACWALTQVVQIYLHNLPVYADKTRLHEFIFYHPLMHLSTFMLGLLVGVFFCDGQLNWLQNRWNGLLALLLTVLTVLVLAYAPALSAWAGILIVYNNGLIAPLFLALIVVLALNTGLTRRMLALPLLVLLGEASYSLYILQRPLYGIYDRTLGKWLALDDNLHFYLFVVLLTVASVVSFQYLETPLRRFINSLYSLSRKSS